MSFRPCAVIPAYNHYLRLGPVIEGLRALELPVFVIDDGNVEPAQSGLAAFHAPERGVEVVRKPVNEGKGAAVIDGLRLAAGRGFTHALQIDADGQHEPAQAARFLELARANPTAVVTGAAVYDETVPKARKFGRYITHFWVWVETASLDIADSMCGFRLYPLGSTVKMLSQERIGPRMQFDTEILVQLHWRRVPVINVLVKVIYPPDNTSNFAMLEDNVRISLMHLGLIVQAPVRLVMKLFRTRPKP
ncbi:glycosyltransferase [Caulobacter sp. SLTY]|uniref:glycosyltransferase family 2 protein n=1 Tax=Caulobacter sp. SLTY TaxID=2683262 RepID=UPI00141359CD|nr:glycosyltransferase family 2 protein [Caulobacter sp. SLTY]NBB14688.1 glycosyltransferase [Caulobacter sp. SLTY]